MTMKITRLLTLLASICAAAPVAAHGEATRQENTHEGTHGAMHAAGPASPATQQAWGIAGDAARVSRTVEFRMGDDMRFTPAQLRVKRGQTLRLRVRNDGQVMHEYVLGTRTDNAAHADMMNKSPDMAHEEAYMAHVPPGQTREIVWTFNRAGSFEFACLIAGHYQAGMKGLVEVEP